MVLSNFKCKNVNYIPQVKFKIKTYGVRVAIKDLIKCHNEI